MPIVVTKALSLVTTVTFADVFTLTEASGVSLPTLPDDAETSFPTFPDASGVSLSTLPGISGLAGFDDSVAPVPTGAVPLGPWPVLPEFTAVGYGGPRGPVPRGIDLDGNCTAVETVFSVEELESAVLAIGAGLGGTLYSRVWGGRMNVGGLEFDLVLEGAELRGIGTDEANVLGSGATEVTLLFSASFPGPY